MRQHSLLIGFATVLPTALAWVEPNPLAPRQTRSAGGDDDDSGGDYEALCRPDYEDGETIPPCISIEYIEAQCQPNGTQPIHLDGHAQCMCGGSFFAEKLACERCLTIHGFRSELDYTHYSDVLSIASEALCTGTPSAAYASIFSSARDNQPFPSSGASVASDEADGDTAVSLYYTATGPQGAGEITGAAASATPEITTSSTSDEDDSETTTTTTATGTADDAEETGDSETTSDDDSAAMPTAFAGGMVWGAAGVAMMAAL